LETFPVESSGNGTFQRIPLEGQPEQRVYVYSSSAAAAATSATATTDSPTAVVHRMYWMQSQSDEGEDEAVAKVNQYLVSPQDAAPESPQVDALSNILEHLGMPQQQSSSTFGGGAPATATTVNTTTTTTTNASSASMGGTLTLADLQGAMAGLGGAATTATTTTEPIPLHQVVTPAAIQSLDEAAKARLLELLPEEQRTMEHLQDNLMSPQIQQTLRALSQAMLPDEQGQLDGYHSVIANFQLDPRDGEAALTSGNPIQAFLDCVLASVEKEESEEQEGQQHEEEEEESMQE
jgi:hypothetical protein